MKTIKSPVNRFSLMFAGLFLLLIMAACGGNAVNPINDPFTSTVTPTPTTKLYTNERSSFSIGFPQGWEPAGDPNVTHEDDCSATYTPYKARISVRAVSNRGLMSAAQLMQKLLTEYKEAYTDFKSDPPKDVTIGGKTWTQVTWTGKHVSSTTGEVSKGRIAINLFRDKQFYLEYEAAKSNFDAADTKYFHLMEQSFKFK